MNQNRIPNWIGWNSRFSVFLGDKLKLELQRRWRSA